MSDRESGGGIPPQLCPECQKSPCIGHPSTPLPPALAKPGGGAASGELPRPAMRPIPSPPSAADRTPSPGEEARLRGALQRIKTTLDELAAAGVPGGATTLTAVALVIEETLSAPRVVAVPDTFLPPSGGDVEDLVAAVGGLLHEAGFHVRVMLHDRTWELWVSRLPPGAQPQPAIKVVPE